MIDMHCHILPEIDDGASDINESLEMARMAARDGIRAIVATPHVSQGVPCIQKINESARMLKEVLEKTGVKIRIFTGAEIAFPSEIKDLDVYSINATKNVLIEFPHAYLPINSINYIERLVSEGYFPIIAHPERNHSVIRNPALLFEMIEKGASAQITSSSITGDFGRDIQSLSVFLLKKKAVHFIASDSHGTRHRKPVLSSALKYAEKIADISYLSRLVYENPLRVLQGRRAL